MALAQVNMRKVEFQDIGTVRYGPAWDFQTTLFERTVDQKLVNRKTPERAEETTDHLIFVEHPPVFTLGKSGKEAHLLSKHSRVWVRHMP